MVRACQSEVINTVCSLDMLHNVSWMGKSKLVLNLEINFLILGFNFKSRD